MLANMSVSSRDGAVLHQHLITLEAKTHRRGDEFWRGATGDYGSRAYGTTLRPVYVKRTMIGNSLSAAIPRLFANRPDYALIRLGL
jgi:hypothetical protein